MNKNLLIFGAIAAGLFLAAKVAGAAGAAVSAGYTNARDAVASGLYRLLGPTEKFGPGLFYTVKFADGNHSVPSDTVDANGYFSRAGKNYRLLIDTRIKSGINKTAIPV